MSRLLTRLRPGAPLGAIALAGLALAACGASVPLTSFVTGVPSTSISVPLSSVACPRDGLCVAVGSAQSLEGWSAVAEYRRADGRWVGLRVPSTAAPLVTSASCWSDACLLAGTQSDADLLWTFRATTASLSSATPPPGGHGVEAISCFGAQSCAVVDSSGVTGPARLSYTLDGGYDWSAPLTLAWSSGYAVTSLACSDVLDCLVVANQSNSDVVLEATRNGGLSWRLEATPSSWTAMTSLSCDDATCVGLASAGGSSLLATSRDFGARWSTLRLGATASAVACPSATRCVVAGETTHEQPWLATVRGRRATVLSLEYVPSPLTDVACGSSVCAAIAISTVVALHP